MVSARRWWVALLTAALLLAGSAAAWLYFGPPSPKAPARARQVMATELEDRAAPAPWHEENR
jgi:hypothetical protein